MTPLISVILPIKNSQSYICESLDSILNQSFQDFELIIIDDGCTDDSISLVKKLCSAKIRIIKNKGTGIADALNMGIEFSRAEFVCRMDADDISARTRLENQINFFYKNQELDILGTKVSYGASMNCSEAAHSVLNHQNIKYSLLFQNPLIHPSIMFKKSKFVRNGQYYNPKYNGSEDYELWTRCMMDNFNFDVLDSTELFYRVHLDQYSNKANTHISNLVIKCNYGSFFFGDLIDTSSIEYLQLMTSGVIFISKDKLDNLIVKRNKLIEISNNKILHDHLYNNSRAVFKHFNIVI